MSHVHVYSNYRSKNDYSAYEILRLFFPRIKAVPRRKNTHKRNASNKNVIVS